MLTFTRSWPNVRLRWTKFMGPPACSSPRPEGLPGGARRTPQHQDMQYPDSKVDELPAETSAQGCTGPPACSYPRPAGLPGGGAANIAAPRSRGTPALAALARGSAEQPSAPPRTTRTYSGTPSWASTIAGKAGQARSSLHLLIMQPTCCDHTLHCILSHLSFLS